MSIWRFFYYSFPGIELEDESENSNLVLAGNLNWSLGYLITTIITCQFDDFFLLLVSRNRIGRRVGRRSNFFGTSKEGTREETTSEQQKSRQNAQADVVGGCRADKS